MEGAKIKLNVWFFSTLALLVLFLLSFFNILKIGGKAVQLLTAEEAGRKAIEYINKNLVQGGKATLVRVEEFSGMYKVVTSYRGREIPVYITKDGKYLFVSNPFDTSESLRKTIAAQSCESLPKRKKPILRAFVVSYCPFGLQMLRVLNEIVKNIPEMADYIEVRYLGSIENGKIRSMHGDKEATENLKEICIREEQSDKFWKYIDCFIKKGESEKCLDVASVDKGKLEDCMNDSQRGLKYAEEDFDLQAKYRVTGSPTLILNDQRVNEYNFGGRSAEAVKTIICCGFEEKPEFCKIKLTEKQANRGFSVSYSGSTTGKGVC